MRCQFLMQRFSEQENVSLGCCIGSVAGDCLISEKTSCQEDMTAPALHHIACKDISELGPRDHVQLQHISDLFKRLIEEGAVYAVAGIVHQNINRNATLVESGFEFDSDARSGQVH